MSEKNTLSNQEVMKIQQLAQKAPYRGKTTVRHVFRVAVTVGLDKIDDNGNIIIQ
ncbi:MAG: hypothetical protein L3J74_05450 [Bacteroidales bacterium]|nr:hypothetical protein [Bacteroidales bacterium]